jgi:hypothetical protein
VIINIDRYEQLGGQRRVFEDWLRNVGLYDRDLFEIQFGEGQHICTGYVRDPATGNFQRDRLEDGNIHIVRKSFLWTGPLPPDSVLERVKQLDRGRE